MWFDFFSNESCLPLSLPTNLPWQKGYKGIEWLQMTVCFQEIWGTALIYAKIHSFKWCLAIPPGVSHFDVMLDIPLFLPSVYKSTRQFGINISPTYGAPPKMWNQYLCYCNRVSDIWESLCAILLVDIKLKRIRFWFN